MQIPTDPRFKDLTGKKFGRLTVKFYEGSEKKSYQRKHYWNCICECGNKLKVEGSGLKSGKTQSCGCLQREKTSAQRINLLNKKFGRLKVIKYVGISKEYKYKKSQIKIHNWLCLCDCGNQKEIAGNKLRNGDTQSCGCLQKDKIRERIIDLTGKVFGRLTVLRIAKNPKTPVHWVCKCECGKKVIVGSANLTSGNSKSCGCRKGKFTHGMYGKPGYKALYLSDPVKKLRHIVGCSVRTALFRRGLSKNGGRTFEHLPYTPMELKEHLESQFEEWMNWDNYGGKNNSSKKTWHIDHIKPQSSFNFTSLTDPEFQECWALKNLRPLEKIENMKKGYK